MKIKVKFNTAIVFPDLSFSANSVVEIDEELVKPLIEVGVADLVADNIPLGTKINDELDWKPATKAKKTNTKKKNEESVE